jgi:hypothetical protein
MTTLTIAQTVDKLGKLHAQIATLQDEFDLLKVGITESCAGKLYKVSITSRTTARLDTKLVRKILTPAQQDVCTVETTSSVFKVLAR